MTHPYDVLFERLPLLPLSTTVYQHLFNELLPEVNHHRVMRDERSASASAGLLAAATQYLNPLLLLH